MVENDGTGASSTGKSLLESLHETGGGKETWEVQNKITENDDVYGQDIPWIEVFARNSVGLDLSPCVVMITDILLPVMMIPGGIILVTTLCIIMLLHQLALTVFLPRRPFKSSPVCHWRILRRLLQSLRHLPSSSASVHSGSKSRGATLPSNRNRRRKNPTLCAA
jgi:hypothetical protein